MKSLNWIQLTETEWLLVCVGHGISLPLKDEIELHSKGIEIRQTGVVSSTAQYTWQTYNVWKKEKSELTKNDMLLVETAFNKN